MTQLLSFWANICWFSKYPAKTEHLSSFDLWKNDLWIQLNIHCLDTFHCCKIFVPVWHCYDTMFLYFTSSLTSAWYVLPHCLFANKTHFMWYLCLALRPVTATGPRGLRLFVDVWWSVEGSHIAFLLLLGRPPRHRSKERDKYNLGNGRYCYMLVW